MKYNIIQVYHGRIADEEEDLTLMELCRFCRVGPEFILELVNEGILNPSGRSTSSWRFPFSSVESVRKVVRFQRDLEVNLAGAALAIHLLDKIEELESLRKK